MKIAAFEWSHNQAKCSCPLLIRRGWLAESMPVALKGIGGPGAPHVMYFCRRVDAGVLHALQSIRTLSYLMCMSPLALPHFERQTLPKKNNAAFGSIARSIRTMSFWGRSPSIWSFACQNWNVLDLRGLASGCMKPHSVTASCSCPASGPWSDCLQDCLQASGFILCFLMSLFQSFLVPCIHTAFSDVSLLSPVVLASCGSAEWDSRSNHRQLDEISANFAAARVWLNAGCRLFGELVQRLIGQNALAGSERVFCLHICYTNKVYDMCDLCALLEITTRAAAAAVLGSQDQTSAEPARTPSAIRFVLKDWWFLLSWFSAAMVSVDIELPKSFAGLPPSKCCRIGLRFLPYLCLSQSALIYVIIADIIRFHLAPRLQLPGNHRQLSRQYREQCTLQAAAKVWAEGVPWPEALALAGHAIDRAYPPTQKGKGKGKARARPLPKGKGKGRGRA